MKTACKKMITQQVSEILRIEIEDGDLYPGTKIPTDTELAEMFGVQKQSVRTAIEVLVKEGLLKYISDKEIYQATFIYSSSLLSSLLPLNFSFCCKVNYFNLITKTLTLLFTAGK